MQPHPDLPGVSVIVTRRGVKALISTEDAAEAGRFNWTEIPRLHTTYVGRQVRRENGKACTEFLHRFIGRLMGFPAGDLTDHRDGNGLDCRRTNLRPATDGQNAMNSRLRRDNTSGLKGVHWDKREGRWRAYIGADGRQHNLGYFDSFDAAGSAVSAARKELHGEYANEGGR